ncbi:MAG: PAS domain-containing sensor histidine kinase [bacterium]
MVYSRFRLICLVRVIILSATIFLLFYLWFNSSFYVTISIVAASGVYQVYALIHFVEKTERDLTRFLLCIKHEDFSESFTARGRSSAARLRAAFAEVMGEFRKIRALKEEHYRYLQTVVQHVGIGLVVFTENGDVELINTAAKRIFNISHLKNVHALEREFGEHLVKILLGLESGQKRIVKLADKHELLQLAIYATEFRMKDHRYTMISIQNIQSELEEKELEAWQNLIRVLTHEIMNSITPIASLSATIEALLDKPEAQNGVGEELFGDIQAAVQTISKRSNGLLHFVDSFRNLSKIPKPKFQIIPVRELFQHLQSFFQHQFAQNSIRCEFQVQPESLELTADRELIEQVLINLVLNAIHAVRDQPEPWIGIRAYLDERGHVMIEVADKGPGIEKEALDKIFIPFFTTKPAGTGIGLSLARQIMRLHRGTITVQSVPHEKTVFNLRF